MQHKTALVAIGGIPRDDRLLAKTLSVYIHVYISTRDGSMY